MTKLLLFLGTAGVVMAGCASQSELPESNLTVKAVFESVTPTGDVEPINPPGGVSLHDFTRTAATELKQLFPKLPNPTLLIYVVPHRSGGLPVPGHMTAISMYPADPFGLPGETVGSAAVEVNP